MCMACCSGAAPDPRRDDGGKLLGSAAQPGAGCVVQCTRSPATGAGCDGGESAADAVSAAPPWCSVVVGRGHGCGQRTRERRWRRGCHVSSVIAFGYSFEEDMATSSRRSSSARSPRASPQQSRVRTARAREVGGGGGARGGDSRGGDGGGRGRRRHGLAEREGRAGGRGDRCGGGGHRRRRGAARRRAWRRAAHPSCTDRWAR